MTTQSKPRIIALEEHYWDQEVAATYGEANDLRRATGIVQRLYDSGELRLKEMDEAGIDVQVLSHAPPAAQAADPATSVKLAAGANDRLKEIVLTSPDRFAGFATLPTPDPAAAAQELERCVTRHGFKGAMVHGLTEGQFIDNKRFWPIFERAQALDVPIYIHPASPHPAVVEAYYQDYLESFPSIRSAGWGYTVETATQGIRLVLSGVFDEYTDLKIIIGHLGESIPFSLWRIDQAMSRPGNADTSFSFKDYFCKHFWITTSGNFSNPALLCCVMEMGVDRILYSVDWPFVDNMLGAEWIPTIPLGNEDKMKILSGNAEKLLKL
ncbi:MAG: amidohydrolase family protein [Dehalococcoidia bacterium]